MRDKEQCRGGGGGGGGLMGNVIQERSYHFEQVPFNYNRFKPRTVCFEGKQHCCTVLCIYQ